MKTDIKRKILSAMLALMFFACCPFTATAQSSKTSEEIIILYENDVHCAIEGYSKLSALKKELLSEHDHVGVVSSGDFLQGSSIGSVSEGEYIVQLMNMTGYDAVAPGNHEFDYRMPRLDELTTKMSTPPVCCNFRKEGADSSYFLPYTIISYGETDIAYIGITTPTTLTSSSPAQFLDEQGNYAYTFCAENLYETVQDAVDCAISDGADYVIALSHLGYDENDSASAVTGLIRNTSGLDVVLDGHSHSVIENITVADKSGNDVVLSSAGTKFAYIGKLTIGADGIKTELIATEELKKTDAAIDGYIKKIDEEQSQLGNRKTAFSEVALITHDPDENRIIRTSETNLGDLCSDAFRIVTGADAGYVNGGGIRSDLPTGDITFNDLLDVFPFDNQVSVAEISGQVIKDMLEMAMMSWPDEDGAFPHVSGIKFSVNTEIPSSVTVDENEMFISVDGEYRVYDITVLDSKSGKYEKLDTDKTYTIAAQNYFLQEYGSGMQMFEDAKIIRNDGILDLQILEKYIVEDLGGVIGEQYAQMTPNITFTDGFVSEKNYVPVYVIAAIALIALTCTFVFIRRKNKH